VIAMSRTAISTSEDAVSNEMTYLAKTNLAKTNVDAVMNRWIEMKNGCLSTAVCRSARFTQYEMVRYSKNSFERSSVRPLFRGEAAHQTENLSSNLHRVLRRWYSGRRGSKSIACERAPTIA